MRTEDVHNPAGRGALLMARPRIRCTEDISQVLNPSRPVVALYSGGLDSSYLLMLLRDAGLSDVTALTVDLGDGPEEESLAMRAERLGAKLLMVDARRSFAENFVLPAIQAQAYYLGVYPISSSLSRPLMAQIAMTVADRCGAQAIVHAARPSQNSLRRINGSLELLGYAGVFGTPYELSPVARATEAAELAEAGITGLANRSISLDTNLWCREFESGTIDDPEDFAVPEDLYTWTRAGQEGRCHGVTITYQRGVPAQRDGRPADLISIIAELNEIAGAHQIGRYEGLEHLSSQEKVLEVREMPAARVLLTSYAHLLLASVDADTIREKMHMDQVWVKEAVEGRWFGRLRVAAQQFISAVSAEVSGTVRLEFSHDRVRLVSIRAATPLYVRNREEWEKNAGRLAYFGAADTAQLEPELAAFREHSDNR